MSRHKHYKTVILTAVVCLIFALSIRAQEPHKVAYNAYKKGDYQTAIRLFRDTTDEYPEWFFGHYWLGRSYQSAGNLSKAIESYKMAANFAESANDKFKVNYYLADSCYNKKEYGNALKYVNVAIGLTSAKGYSQAKRNMIIIKGYSEFHTRKYRNVPKTFEAMVANPSKEDINILKTVAKSLRELERDMESVAVLKKVVRLDPRGDITPHKIIVSTLYNNEKWKDTISSAEYAVQYHSGDSELFFFKGCAEYYSGSYRSAATSLEKSVSLHKHAATHKMLGDAYSQLKKWQNAIDQYDQAEKSGEFANDPDFYITFAFLRYSIVPDDAEEHHGKPTERVYKGHLDAAEVLLEHAEGLSGVDKSAIDGILTGIENKRMRLEQGKFFEETYIVTIDPETGKIKKVKAGSEDDKSKSNNN